MTNEIKFMEQNTFWDIVELLKCSKWVECKCVFKTKRESNDNIKQYKIRIVAKDYT